MTSDAKIGLLLGLIFIFAIAFVINGLPRFRTAADSNELTADMLSSQNGSPPIAARERKAQKHYSWQEQVRELPLENVQPAVDDQEETEDVRFEMELPESIPIAKDFSMREIAEHTEPTLTNPIELVVRSPVAETQVAVEQPEPVKPAGPKTYVVTEGDNLGTIAHKFYGPVEGNKQANVTRIFQANRTLLKSPDEIYVGQKLVIPPLPASAQDEAESGSSLSGRLFETVKSIGRRHPSADNQKAQRSKQYLVQDGDSLWTIAVEQLGSGVRYKEIAELNADILRSEDDLIVGMRLKMPAR